MMLVHSIVIGIALYAIMFFGLGQRQHVAEYRSILLAAISLAYMIMFGHRLPTRVNKELF